MPLFLLPVFILLIGLVATIVAVSMWTPGGIGTRKGVVQRKAVSICDARDGEVVKIVGRVRLAGPPLDAPMSGRRCAYYRLIVTQRNLLSEATHVVILDEKKVRDFVLEDDTGRALVRLSAGGAVDCGAGLRLIRRSMFAPAPDAERLAAFDRRHPKLHIDRRGTLIFDEAVIEEGARVAAIGLARWEPDADAGDSPGSYREPARRLVLLPVGEKSPIQLSAHAAALS